MAGKIIFVKKTAKIALLLFGLLPFIYCILFFTIFGSGESTTGLLFIKILTYISIPVSFVLYVIHACRNKYIVKNQKYLWIALLLVGNYFVFPFYWYLHVWRDNPSQRFIDTNVTVQPLAQSDINRSVRTTSTERKIIFVKKTAKIALLLFGLLPFILFILAFTIVGEGNSTTSLFWIIFFILAAISIPVSWVFYIIHACRNKYIVKNQKYLWIALLYIGNAFVYPFYWYLHVWRVPKEDCRQATHTNDDSGECESIPAR